MAARDASIEGLSEHARRWLTFFHVDTRNAARAALDLGMIAPGKRPELTRAVHAEILAWADPPSQVEILKLPDPQRLTAVVSYWQCNHDEHRHSERSDAISCMEADHTNAPKGPRALGRLESM